MRVLLATAIAGVFLFASPPARAQMPDGSASRTAMQKLDFMVGRWRGEAWMVRGAERVQTTMTEAIERKLGGVALLVEGLGEGGVSWSREVPGGRIRNTAKIANGEWHEVGEFPRDGTTWMQIMEMKLRPEQ